MCTPKIKFLGQNTQKLTAKRGHIDILFVHRTLTLIQWRRCTKLTRKFWKMHLYTKNEDSKSRLPKVTECKQDRQTRLNVVRCHIYWS